MHERRKQDEVELKDLAGEPYQDWDNPEDFDEGEPEGYYEDEPGDDDSYVPQPGDSDYDLSEAAGYAGWEEPTRRGILPGWVIAVFSIVLILAMLIPILLRAS
jgi:hypothetical protein